MFAKVYLQLQTTISHQKCVSIQDILLKPDNDCVPPRQRPTQSIGCILSVTERFLLSPLVVLPSHVNAAPSLSTFRSRLKSHATYFRIYTYSRLTMFLTV